MILEIVEGFNPLTYIPFAKDIWSALQGYDIERSDMSLIADAITSGNRLVSALAKDEVDWAKVRTMLLGFSADVGSLFGFPAKNIIRDVEAVINTYTTVRSDMGRNTTAMSLKNRILEDLQSATPIWKTFPKKTKEDKLYDAILAGDNAYVKRLKSGYKDENAYLSAVKSALRKNDPRIRAAAVALNEGNTAERIRLLRQIIAEGHFSQDIVVTAINNEAIAIKPKTSSTSSAKATSIYLASDLIYAVSQNNSTMAEEIQKDLVATAMKNGKTEDEAVDAFMADARSAFRDGYMAGAITRDQFVTAYLQYSDGDMEEAEKAVEKLDYEKDSGLEYDEVKDAYLDGDISESELKSIYMQYGMKTEEEAEKAVSGLRFQKEFPEYSVSDAAAAKYYKYCQPEGIPAKTFYDAKSKKDSLEGSIRSADHG